MQACPCVSRPAAKLNPFPQALGSRSGVPLTLGFSAGAPLT